MSRRILVVEDDAAIRQGVVDALDFHGFKVIEAERGDDGLEKAIQAEIDLLLLDLVLPGMDGLEVLRQLRGARPALPVIILTARGEESDRVKGLQLGADDYVVKPFGVKELLARVEAVLRRTPERPTDVKTVSFPGGSADLERREIRFDDGWRMADGRWRKGSGAKEASAANRHPPSAVRRVELSEREAELLRYLAANAGRAVSREELLSRVWRLDATGAETRTVDMHVARLREKLRDDPENPRVLMTVRGKGYMFATKAGAGK
jgi:two-component system alkaline phosphatase synthesis response regulator PhoP